MKLQLHEPGQTVKEYDVTDIDFIAFLDANVSYDKDSGAFSWKKKRNGIVDGVFGSIEKKGYFRVKILGKKYLLHRLAWFIVYKQWPEHQIDHINGDRADNRISNLRIVDTFGNAQNRHGPQKNNKSGFLGVHLSGKKWRSQIRANGNLKHLGMFDTPELANQAYIDEKRKIHATCTI